MRCELCDERMNSPDRCEKCGATRQTDGTFKLICCRCGRETGKLYDLFVPHNCKQCSDELHEEARKNKDYCLICGALRMDCCC